MAQDWSGRPRIRRPSDEHASEIDPAYRDPLPMLDPFRRVDPRLRRLAPPRHTVLGLSAGFWLALAFGPAIVVGIAAVALMRGWLD